MNVMAMMLTAEPIATPTTPLNRTARRNAMREAKKAARAKLHDNSHAATETGEQHVWRVVLTLDGEATPWDSIVVATTPEFVKRAMLDNYARHETQEVRDTIGFNIEQLDDGRFEGPFLVVTAAGGDDEEGDLIEGPYASLLEATNRSDDIFDIRDYNAGSRVFDSKGNEVLHLTLKTRDTGVVRYRPGYYD